MAMSTLIRPEFTTVDGLSIRFAEGGNAGHDAILLSPWPEACLPSSRYGLDWLSVRILSPLTHRGSAGRSVARN